MWSLYVHINKINGKRYYGITSQEPEKRWREEGKGYREDKQSIFYRAIQKYKWKNFEHKILATDLTEEEANECEEYYISVYKTNAIRWKDKAKGYNMTDGGDGHKGNTPTEEHKKILSERMKNNTIWIGRHHTEDSKEKISKAKKGCTSWNKGIPMTEEAKQKASISHKGAPSAFKGKHHTEESNNKNRLKHSKPIRNKITGKEYYGGITEAAKDTGHAKKTIKRHFDDWGFEYM